MQNLSFIAPEFSLSRIPEFLWCLRPGCESGQIHDPSTVSNGTKERPANSMSIGKVEGKPENTVKQTTKKCPKCQLLIEKSSNCSADYTLIFEHRGLAD
jgi:hypothetical protein